MSSIGTYTEQKLHRKIKELRQQIADLELFLTNPPFLTVYGIQELLPHSTTDRKNSIKQFLNTIAINPNWILDIVNPSQLPDPDSIQIQFISHCVKERVYTIISDYILTQNINAIISKDDV